MSNPTSTAINNLNTAAKAAGFEVTELTSGFGFSYSLAGVERGFINTSGTGAFMFGSSINQWGESKRAKSTGDFRTLLGV